MGMELPLELKRVEALSFAANAPEGLPLELIPPHLVNSGKPGTQSSSWKATVSAIDEDTEETVVSVPTAGKQPEFQIRQHWRLGEAWWSFCEKSVDGRKVYTARRAVTSPVRPMAPEHEKAAEILASRKLHNDPELRASINMDGLNPQLQMILDSLEDSTGLKFTVADNLKTHYPRFGSVQLKNAPAYVAMELIAKHQLENGRWTRVKEGYHLSGVSKATPEAYPTGAHAASADRFYLRRDPRLQTKTTLFEVDPELTGILQKLNSAAKIAFTVDEALSSHRPSFGSVQLNKVPLWVVMELVAITQIEDGRWERTDDGYRLVGKSLVPGPAPGPVRWPYAAAVIGCASLGFGFLIYRYRRMAPRRLS
jgi:hypothetical protein